MPSVHFNVRRTGYAAAGIVALLALNTLGLPAASATTKVNLGGASPFAVLAGTAVTNVTTSAITGDLGLSPAAGSAYDSGVTSSQVTGTIYQASAGGPGGSVTNPSLLTTAKNNLTAAFIDAAGRTPTTTYSSGDNQLGGKTLIAGVYAFGHATTANITSASPLVLNGQGDVNSVFIFQASSDLVTASNSVVRLENGAQACNVFWVVGSSATLNTSSTFVGTLMALTSASLLTGATVQGRILARNAAVTLQQNTITVPTACLTASATTTTSTPTTTTTATSSGGITSGSAGSGGLPYTGFNSVTALIAGAAALGLGVLTFAIQHVRRRNL